MASYRAEFNDIQIILCAQGYSLHHQFIIRELGYWSRTINGMIPFNCKLNNNLLDITNKSIIHYLENQIHGIKAEKKFDHAVSSGEFISVLRTLYHVTKSYDSNHHFIGICRDENIKNLLFKAGLGEYVFDLDNLNVFREKLIKCPSNKELTSIIKSQPDRYKICFMHDKLNNDEIPVCAKVKSTIIADFCLDQTENL